MAESKGSVIVFGAGMVGCLLGIFLARRGYKVDIMERRSDMRSFGTGEGRSINLAVSERGWVALRKLGLDRQVQEVGLAMTGRMMHNENGNLAYQPYGKSGQAIYSMSRFELNKKLLSLAELEPNISMHFNRRCHEINFKNTTAMVLNTLTGQIYDEEADFIFGADGAWSAVRTSMVKTERFNYSQQYVDHGYKELTIYPNSIGDFAMANHVLHIWPRGNFMMIALPNPDRSFTCTLFFPFEGPVSFASVQTEADVRALFQRYFPDVVPLIPDLEAQFFKHPVGTLVTNKCYPWVLNHTALVGDAAHAIVPFYGQGMNAGFEDCSLLDELLDQYGTLEEALPHYQTIRKPNADAIAELALQNFIEMRDLVARPEFLLRKKVDAALSELYPDVWVPVYTVISFTSRPYVEALERTQRQDRILDQLMQLPDIAAVMQKPEELKRVAEPLIVA